jgi:glycine dehydrogenase subunit 2
MLWTTTFERVQQWRENTPGLDQFIVALRSIAAKARAGDDALKAAPVFAPRRRLDETLAARKPVLTWQNPVPDGADSGEGAMIGGG